MADKKKQNSKKLEVAPVSEIKESVKSEVTPLDVINPENISEEKIESQESPMYNPSDMPYDEKKTDLPLESPSELIDTPIDEIPELKTEKPSFDIDSFDNIEDKPDLTSDAKAEEIKEEKSDDKIVEIKPEEKPEKKEGPSKFKLFVSKYKVPIIIACIVVILALATIITIILINKNYVFISSAEDFSKDTEGKTTYVIKNDITVTGDLTIPHGMNIDLNKNTLTISGNLIYGADAADKDIYIADRKGPLFLDNGSIVAASLLINSPDATFTISSPVTANANVTAKIFKVDSTLNSLSAGSLVITTSEITTLKKVVTLSGDNGVLTITANTANIFDTVNAAGTNSIITITSPKLSITGNIIASIININNSGYNDNLSAIDSSISGTLNINNSSIVFGANSSFTIIIADNLTTLDISGSISNSLTGGLLVIYRSGAVCPLTEDTITLNIYENTAISEMSNIGSVLFFTTLETPTDITISQEGPSFMCYVAKVNNADSYVLTIDSNEPITSASNIINITAFITEPGNHNISVKATSNNPQIAESASNSTVYTYNIKLNTPSITLDQLNGYKIVFDQVSFATSYKYSINNGDVVNFTEFSGTDQVVIDITDKITSAGVYVIKVNAYSTNESAFKLSETATLSYINKITLGAIAKDANPIAVVKDGSNLTLSWDAVPYARYYSIYINDVLTVKTINPSYTWTLGDLADNTTIKVEADAYSYYVKSATASALYQYEQLGTPDLGAGPYIIGDNIVINWDAVPNATAYQVYRNNVAVGTPISESIYTVGYDFTTYGEYTVVASAEFYKSATSSAVTIAIPAIDAPVISYNIIDTNVVISWAPVGNVASYRLINAADSSEIATSTSSPFTFAYTEGGSYYVEATGTAITGNQVVNSNTVIVPAP